MSTSYMEDVNDEYVNARYQEYVYAKGQISHLDSNCFSLSLNAWEATH